MRETSLCVLLRDAIEARFPFLLFAPRLALLLRWALGVAHVGGNRAQYLGGRITQLRFRELAALLAECKGVAGPVVNQPGKIGFNEVGEAH
jgi:hypothetical protein